MPIANDKASMAMSNHSHPHTVPLLGTCIYDEIFDPICPCRTAELKPFLIQRGVDPFWFSMRVYPFYISDTCAPIRPVYPNARNAMQEICAPCLFDAENKRPRYESPNGEVFLQPIVNHEDEGGTWC